MWTWYIFHAFSAIDYRALGFADVAQVARGGRGDPQVVGVGRRFAPVGRRAQHAPLAALAGDDHLARTVLPAKKKTKQNQVPQSRQRLVPPRPQRSCIFFYQNEMTTQRRTVLPTKKNKRKNHEKVPRSWQRLIPVRPNDLVNVFFCQSEMGPIWQRSLDRSWSLVGTQSCPSSLSFRFPMRKAQKINSKEIN